MRFDTKKTIKYGYGPCPVCIVSYTIYSSNDFHYRNPVVGQAQAHVCAHLQHMGRIGRHHKDGPQLGVNAALAIAAQISRFRESRGQACSRRADLPGSSASATRCCCPPSSLGRHWSKPTRPTFLRASPARLRAASLAMPDIFRPCITFSTTFMCGDRA